MKGKIETVQQSKSGKTLRVKVGDQWYSTKNWEMQGLAGKTIEFEPSQKEWQGQVIHWINDYSEAHGAPAGQSESPYGAPNSRQLPSEPTRDRDASIVAQALTKACTAPGDSVNTVWSRYEQFYNLYMGKGESKGPSPNQQMSRPEDDYDDPIPF